uniref:Uncharacterized protein n=1 Tax=Arundo donax TaxID=35708 RepID=A0A0A9GC58_ARUDO
MLPAAKKFPDISSMRTASRTLSYICVAIGKSPTACKYSPYERKAFSVWFLPPAQKSMDPAVKSWAADSVSPFRSAISPLTALTRNFRWS